MKRRIHDMTAYQARGACALVCLALFAGIFMISSFRVLGIQMPVMAFASDNTGSTGDGEVIPIVDPIGETEECSSVLYDNTNGLPTSESNAIAETSDGFIWIGSYSGLIRFDGNTFERIDSTTGIASVVTLFVDSRDRLWVGTNDSGAAIMEGDSFRMFKKADGLKSLSVRCMTEDENGNIYLGTTQGIAIVDSNMKVTTIDDPVIGDEYIRELKLGLDDVIYGVTQSDKVFMMEQGQVTKYYDCADIGLDNVISVTPDPQASGYVYLGTQGSMVYYGNLKSGFRQPESYDIAPLEYANSMEVIQGELWLCTDHGIGRIDETGHFDLLENIPMDDSIDHMMVDYEGNLWFTSSRQGVMKIVPNQFMDIFERYQLEEQVVNTTCMYHDDLYIGTDNGITVLRENGWTQKVKLDRAVTASGQEIEDTAFLDECRVRSIIRDRRDRLWISTYSDYGLICYQNGDATCYTTEDGMPSNRIRAIYECQDGRILAACRGGVAVIDDGAVIRVYNDEDGITNTEVLTVAESPKGDILVGTDGDGIYVIRDNGIGHINTDSGLASDIVMRIKPGQYEDLCWIVTSNSLAYLDSDYQVTLLQEFPYSNNFDLYENKQGDMWILSSNGIYVLPVDELIANEDMNPILYNRDNGLPCVTTANSYSELTEDGYLYISGSTGVVRVNIDVPFENVNNLKMTVPYMEADGERVYPDASGIYMIPAKTKRLTIYGYVFNYTLMNPQVTYYLDGFDGESSTVLRSDFHELNYTNLPGGTYHFVMQIHDTLGNGNKELRIQINKKNKLYETIWFQIIVGVLLILVIAGFVRLMMLRKMRKLQKKEEETKTLVREITRAFAKTIDMKDRYTNGHSFRVAQYTAMLTEELGYDEETVERYYNIALLHDIGKIGIPPEVLNKQGKLTDEEFDIIKSHASLGYNALKEITIMPELAVGAGAHHERPDGRGYPRGLVGEEIPRVAQIIAVADTFDAMYSDRPYRKRMNFDKVVSIMKEVSGTQLTTDVVDAFLRLVEQGKFRAANDHGGGSMDDIDNIRKQYDEA